MDNVTSCLERMVRYLKQLLLWADHEAEWRDEALRDYPPETAAELQLRSQEPWQYAEARVILAEINGCLGAQPDEEPSDE